MKLPNQLIVCAASHNTCQVPELNWTAATHADDAVKFTDPAVAWTTGCICQSNRSLTSYSLNFLVASSQTYCQTASTSQEDYEQGWRQQGGLQQPSSVLLCLAANRHICQQAVKADVTPEAHKRAKPRPRSTINVIYCRPMQIRTVRYLFASPVQFH